MAQISHLIRIQAPINDVYQQIASTAGIAGWFTQAHSSDYRQGQTLELRFPDETVIFEITTLIEPTQIVWHCTSPESPWFNTDIKFDLSVEADFTLVHFDHANWPAITDLFRDCSMSWAHFLHSLRSLLEEGHGTPETLN